MFRRILLHRIGVAELTILALLVAYAGLIEPNWVQITHTEVRIAGLPEQFDGFRIVQLSDLHLHGPWKALPGRYARVAKTVNDLSPDLVAVTGDLISRASGRPLAGDFVSCLRSEHGTYVVWGNWDGPFQNQPETVRRYLLRPHIKVLENEAEPVTVAGAQVWLLGILFSEFSSGGTEEAFRNAREKGYRGRPVVLLSHSPGAWKDAEKNGVDLMLSGHTHGGQVWIPLETRLLWTRDPYPPVYRGLRDLGRTKIYINRGIGTSVIPFRFLSRPEISLIVLRPAS